MDSESVHMDKNFRFCTALILHDIMKCGDLITGIINLKKPKIEKKLKAGVWCVANMLLTTLPKSVESFLIMQTQDDLRGKISSFCSMATHADMESPVHWLAISYFFIDLAKCTRDGCPTASYRNAIYHLYQFSGSVMSKTIFLLLQHPQSNPSWIIQLIIFF